MESYQIRIKGSNGQINVQQLTCYLCQTVLILRDRQNISQTVELQGTGSAIPTCILIAELTARKLLNIAQITEFVPIQKKNGEKQNEIEFITGIRIKLTYAPSEKDKQSPGYQQNKINEQQASNWNNLYEFIMLYVNDLAASKQINQRKISQSRPKQKLPHEDREKSEEKNQITSTTGSAKQRGQQRDQNRGTDREQVRSRGGKK